ncbi:MAG: alcohol dehydrogenase [Euryarchaeota archaeon]|nr:alcohol dehydrogenase [Euryarchaeota archaeon]
MRRIVYTKKGGLDSIDIIEDKTPKLSPNEVLIQVHRAGINFADLMMRQGLYGAAPNFPFTPGYEIAGVIIGLGKDVSKFSEGDRVVSLCGFGGYSEQIAVSDDRTFLLPDEVSFDTAAAMPVTYATAYHMLKHLGNFQKGDSILVHHAAGGVGTAAAQIGRHLGASKIIGTSSAEKSDFVREMGMIHVDREKEDFVLVCKKETDGDGVHHALDPVGGNHLMRSYKSLRSGGRLYCFGASSAVKGSKRSLISAIKMWKSTPKFDPLRMMNSNKAVFGVHLGTWKDQEILAQHMIELEKLLREGGINPIVDKVFRFEDVSKAQKYIHDRKNKGKVLLDFSPL